MPTVPEELIQGCVLGHLHNALDHQGGATPKDALDLFSGAGTFVFVPPAATLVEGLQAVDEAVVDEMAARSAADAAHAAGVNHPVMIGDSGAGGVKGMVPAPGAGDAAAGKFLKADGAWALPSGGGSSSLLPGTLAKSAAYTVVTGDRGYVIVCDTSGGAFAVTLPTTPADGFAIFVVRKNTGTTNPLTVVPGGTDVLEGPSDATSSSYTVDHHAMAGWSYEAASGKWWSMALAPRADAGTAIPSLRTLGTTGYTACAGNDGRLSNSRAPTGAAGGHLTGSYPDPTVGPVVAKKHWAAFAAAWRL